MTMMLEDDSLYLLLLQLLTWLCVCVCACKPNLISFDNEHLLQPCFATLLNGRTQFGVKRRGKLVVAALGEAQITLL